jgi:hypothetical protein
MSTAVPPAYEPRYIYIDILQLFCSIIRLYGIFTAALLLHVVHLQKAEGVLRDIIAAKQLNSRHDWLTDETRG